MIIKANFGTVYVYPDGYGEGYNDGEKKAYNEFWDNFQQNGALNNYPYAFSGVQWNDATFKPKYNIILGAGYTGNTMFWKCAVTNIAEVLERQGVRLDTTNCGELGSMFMLAESTRIPEINATHAMDNNSDGLFRTFMNSKAETIDKLVVTENLKYTSTFQDCTNLKNIVFEGVIGQSIDFQWSTNLTRASIINIFEHLSDTASGKLLTLPYEAVRNAFPDGEEISEEFGELVGTKLNWEMWLT